MANDRRTAVLGADYAGSEDRAFTTSGDATGFHLMVAEERQGYAWQTAASLFEPGFEADSWIGNACLTESGRYAAVAYAPRTFTNKPDLMGRGAFTAFVDLDSGEVRKLPFQATLGYFSPGCGRGEEAVFSQYTDELTSRRSETRLLTVDARDGKADKAVLPGQLTSAVPVGEGRIVAARGNRLVRVTGKTVRVVAATHGVPFQLSPDADGGVTFIDRVPAGKRAEQGETGRAQVSRVDAASVRAADGGAKAVPLAEGDLTAFDLARTPKGQVFVTGEAKSRGVLPGAVRNPGGIGKGAALSSRGAAAVTSTWADGHAGQQATAEARPARITLKALDTGKTTVLDSVPGERIGGATAQKSSAVPSPALTASAPAAVGSAAAPRRAAATASAASLPSEGNRVCAVPRGDVREQAYQPTPRQVEWAVDQAVVGALNTHASRPADWKNTGMSAYAPQSLFPLSPLGGGSGSDWHIPAQILLGITAQESNMWQATRYALPGVSANPLIGNYYGVHYTSSGEQTDPWAIDWSEADCGYGITQVTDHMRKADTTWSQTQKDAVALDYAANIAAGADILADKWNQTRADGLIINNGEARWIENWFYALWAYNSGYYPQADAATKNSGKWGVGWTNNPANPLWKENRTPFLENTAGNDDYSHASHPQDWPYEEKVIGWAARPISALFGPGDSQPGYRMATWLTDEFRTQAKPPIDLFCDESNDCNRFAISENSSNNTGAGPCLLPGADNASDPLYLKCWYHQPAEWKDCGPATRACGYWLHRFPTSYVEQPDGQSYRPRCGGGLPTGALIVDDVTDGVTPTGSKPTDTPAGSLARTCGSVTSNGTFGFEFGGPSSEIDLHQIGAGYDNHFWFSHTYTNTADSDLATRLKTTGTWTLTTGNRGWMKVWVHLPDHGAHTRQAEYTVAGSDSTSRTRVRPQRTGGNNWVSLGAFNFTGVPKVSLPNVTRDGTGAEDVAWDSVAFEPLTGKPKHQIVSMGDSYASGEGVTTSGGLDYSYESDYDDPLHPEAQDACHRSTKAWARQATLPGEQLSVGELADSQSPDMDFQFVACSGARHYHIIGDGQNGELGQIQQGFLDQHTDLVTLSIGGNDMRFTDVVTMCIATPDCFGASLQQVDPDTGEKETGLTLPMRLWAPDWAHDMLRPRLAKTLKAIHDRAPNARIVLMGYPQLLNVTGVDAPLVPVCGDVLGLSNSEGYWLNELADLVATEMAGAVDDVNSTYGANAVFSDPRDEFAGRGICSEHPGLHAIVLEDRSDADNAAPKPSMKSFHPNIDGARLYTESLEDTLNNS